MEEIRQYLEHTYGTAAVHEQGLRVYTTLNVAMQNAADQAVRDGLHAYDRRHGWRGNLPNILAQNLAARWSKYQNEDWRSTIAKGRLRHRLVTAVEPTFASRQDRAVSRDAHAGGFCVDRAQIAAADLLKVGDLVCVSDQGSLDGHRRARKWNSSSAGGAGRIARD